MSIFKKGKLSKPQFVSKVVSAIISLLGFGFMWTIPFPGDTVKETGGLSFSAMHVTFNIVFLTLLFVYIVILMRKSLDEDLEFDFEPQDEDDYGSYYAGAKTLLFLLLVIVLGSRVYEDSKSIYNQSVLYQNQYTQVGQEKETYYDNMWKSYKLKENIVIDNKATFIEVTKMIMDGRRDGSNLTWKWLQENQPIPYSEFTKFYADLSSFVESQRAGYLALEVKSQGIARDNNTMLDCVPNNIYNKFLNRSHIDYKPGFTSSKTIQVFKSGLEEIE